MARVAGLMVLAAAAFGLLAARLAYLQLVRGPELAVEAFRQRANLLPLELPRGDIYDRHRRALNAPVVRWRVIVHRPAVPDPDALAVQLAARLGLDAATLQRALREARQPFLTIHAEAAPAVAQRLAREALPGVLVVPQRERYGPGVLAPHVLGYVNRIDNRGMDGLERAFDRWLRGAVPAALVALHDGRRQAMGAARLLPARPEQAGADVITTLDAGIQAASERALAAAGRPGAAVVVDVTTGDVLAMASAPGYHPARVADVLDDPGAPLLNRALRAYPPGSVFKLVVAIAALEEGVLRPDELFPCQGEARVGERRVASRCPPGPGPYTWQEALAHSSNEVFIELARRLGPERLRAWAQRLGFGAPAGTGLPGEAAGTLPPGRLLRSPGELANLAIGQGPLTVTPVQVARLVAAIAGDGRLPGLRLVTEVRRADGLLLQAYAPPAREPVFRAATARQLRGAMRLAVTEGTGQAAEVPSWGAAGKTGTAETGRDGPGGAPPDHAWFAGYVPAYLPRFAIVVLLEGGGSGPAAAAPVFRQIALAALAGR